MVLREFKDYSINDYDTTLARFETEIDKNNHHLFYTIEWQVSAIVELLSLTCFHSKTFATLTRSSVRLVEFRPILGYPIHDRELTPTRIPKKLYYT